MAGKCIKIHVKARNGRGAMGAVTIILDERAAQLAGQRCRGETDRPLTEFLAEGIEHGLGEQVQAIHSFETRQVPREDAGHG